jgi:GntR family transcriptional repressor for pyruvate dehydrogenase complex
MTKTRRPAARRILVRDTVFTRLRRYISQQKLKPGDALPSEIELSRRFGVSRPSMREALTALRQLGLLHSAPRRGLTVGTLDPQRLGECLEVHASISEYSSKQLVRARAVIEIGILPFVAHALQQDAALVERLRALVSDPAVVTDPKRYIQADLSFHQALLVASGVTPMAFFNQVLAVFFRRFGRHAAGPNQAGRENGVRQHLHLIDTLAAGRLEDAQVLVLRAFDHYALFETAAD